MIYTIKGHVRVAEMASENSFYLLDCEVFPSRNLIIRNGISLTVEPKVMDTLVALSHQPGKVISRNELITEVWKDYAVSDEAITRCIFILRKSFKQLGVKQKIIETVRKRGYRLNIPHVKQQSDDAVKSMYANKKNPLLSYLASLLLLLFGLLISHYWPSKQDKIKFTDNNIQANQILTILPIQNKTLDKENEVIAQSVQHSIADILGRQPGVIARIKNNPHPQEKELVNAYESDYLIEGFLVNKELKQQLFITMRDKDGSILLNKNYPLDEKNKSLAIAQRVIASDVMAKLNNMQIQHDYCDWPSNHDSLSLYFEAQRIIGMRGVPNLKKAIQLLKQAIEIEPNFSHAWSSMAYSYDLLPIYLDQPEKIKSSATYRSLAVQSAQKALMLCGGLGQAYLIAGDTPEYGGTNPFMTMEYRFQKAMQLDPSNGEIPRFYAEHLFRVGRLSESEAMMQYALKIDPWNPRAYRDNAEYYINRKDFKEAQNQLRLAEELGFDGSKVVWLRFYIETKQWDKARELLNIKLQEGAPIYRSVISTLEAPDDTQLRQKVLALLNSTLSKNNHQQIYAVHRGALWLDEVKLAHDAWEKVDKVVAHHFTLWWPQGVNFRNDPRFFEFAQTKGLVEYWKTFKSPDYCTLKVSGLECSNHPN